MTNVYTQNITINHLYPFSGFTMYLNIVLCLCQERGCRLTVWYQLIEGCSTAVHPLQDLELCPPTPSVAILLITITIRSLPSSVQCSLSLVSSTLYSVRSFYNYLKVASLFVRFILRVDPIYYGIIIVLFTT